MHTTDMNSKKNQKLSGIEHWLSPIELYRVQGIIGKFQELLKTIFKK